MRYQEVSPHPELQPYILNYWCFQVPAYAEVQRPEISHTAPADGCVSLLLIYSQPGNFRQALLVGPRSGAIHSVVHPDTMYLGIRFVPGMFAALFDDQGLDLKDQTLPAADFVPGLDTDALTALLGLNFSDFAALDALLLKVLASKLIKFDPEVNRAVRAILDAGGNVVIRQLVEQACRSERQLQKSFRRSTYLTMKELARICRLRTTIIRHHLQKRSLADTVYEAGYFDQAHYNHELSQATGQRPADFYGHISQIEHQGVKPYHE